MNCTLIMVQISAILMSIKGKLKKYLQLLSMCKNVLFCKVILIFSTFSCFIVVLQKLASKNDSALVTNITQLKQAGDAVDNGEPFIGLAVPR